MANSMGTLRLTALGCTWHRVQVFRVQQPTSRQASLHGRRRNLPSSCWNEPDEEWKNRAETLAHACFPGRFSEELNRALVPKVQIKPPGKTPKSSQ